MNDADILDWVANDRAPLPTTPNTAGNGLQLVSPPRTGDLEEGSGYSTPTGATLTAGTAHPTWNSTGPRLMVKNTTAMADRTIVNVNMAGRLETQAGFTGVANFEDGILNAGLAQANCAKQADASGEMNIRRTRVTGSNNAAIVLWRGELEGLRIDAHGSDGVTPKGAGRKRMKHSLIRDLGYNLNAHPDCNQTTTGDVSDWQVWFSTLYHPGKTTAFEEGAIGSSKNQCLRWVAELGNVSDLAAVGCDLIGGSFTCQFAANPTKSANGLVAIRNWASKAGAGYTLNGTFHGGNLGGAVENFVLSGNRYREDGSVWMLQNGTPAEGLFFWNKATCPPNARAHAEACGFVDWNGDPLVPNRTDFYAN